MKTKNSSLTAKEQATFAKTIVRDPVKFANKILGLTLWEGEVEILRSIQTQRRTAVKSCHGIGKTFDLAIATLWWLARYPDGIVLTTSPTERQVRTQLWAEIRRMVERAKFPFPKVNMTDLKLRGDNNFAIGFSTNQAENFQGYHGRNILIIADEAPGIDSGVWDAVGGTMAGGNVHIVMAGNPTKPSGAFFDAFTNERSLWNCITVTAFDSPNLMRLSLEQLLLLDPAEGGPLDQNPYPYLVTRRWVYEQYHAWWHGSESSSPNWLSRVMAQFPDQSEFALIKLSWLERAKQRTLLHPIGDDGTSPLVAGVDVGGGGDGETVVYVCDRDHERSTIIAIAAWRGEDTRGQAVSFLNKFRSRLSMVYVDGIGVGHNFGLHLRDFRFPVDLVNVGRSCDSKPNWKENDPARRFVNQRASFYQGLADAFERDQIDGLMDEATIGQLAGILYEMDAQGRTKIESKENARQRGVRSPDRADALMLALSKPPQKFEYFSARNSSAVKGAPFGDDDYDPDDYIDNTQRGWRAEFAPGRLSRFFRKGTCY
jgi:hypothetical protein